MTTFSKSFQTLLASATVAAHASFHERGIRSKDVRFFFHLFSNWLTRSRNMSPQFTQITRHLDALVKEGFAKRKQLKKRPVYHITRLGLIELLSRITEQPEEESMESFIFSIYFVQAYRERLIQLVEREGKQFPLSLKIQLEGLLDSKSHLENKINALKIDLKKMEIGIEDAEATSKLASVMRDRRAPLHEIVEAVEKQYPYELHSEKPLRELIEELPPEARLWELTDGNKIRTSLVFRPLRNIQEAFLKELEKVHRDIWGSNTKC